MSELFRPLQAGLAYNLRRIKFRYFGCIIFGFVHNSNHYFLALTGASSDYYKLHIILMCYNLNIYIVSYILGELLLKD